MIQINDGPPRGRTPRARGHAVAALLAAASLAAAAQTGPQPKLRTIDLKAGMHVIKAEVAQTMEQLTTGLMFRPDLPGNEGMLFVYPEAGIRCFWMKNTIVPLSIAFIADDGTIVNIADMQPQSERSHCSAKPVRYALEMKQGWYAQRGIKPGFQLKGAPFGN